VDTELEFGILESFSTTSDPIFPTAIRRMIVSCMTNAITIRHPEREYVIDLKLDEIGNLRFRLIRWHGSDVVKVHDRILPPG